MCDPTEDVLEVAVRALRSPVRTSAARKARIMELVRASAWNRRRARSRRWMPRTGWVSPVSQLALAACATGVMVLGALRSLVPSRGASHSAVAAGVMGDSVASTIRDTLRLVRFIFVSPTASRVALAGDFNDWSAMATPLRPAAESAGVWSVAVALAPGRHRYSFVVDDTEWVADPRAPRTGHAPAGKPASVMTVTTTPD